MTFWFLYTALLLVGNQPAFALPLVFDTQMACENRGLAFADEAKADPTVDRAVWTCARVDFEKADPRA